jgi:hypothetical protein
VRRIRAVPAHEGILPAPEPIPAQVAIEDGALGLGDRLVSANVGAFPRHSVLH